MKNNVIFLGCTQNYSYLFSAANTKVEFLEKEMQIQRLAATRYLNKMVEAGILEKVKVWRTNYYINKDLMALFLMGSNLAEEPGTVS